MRSHQRKVRHSMGSLGGFSGKLQGAPPVSGDDAAVVAVAELRHASGRRDCTQAGINFKETPLMQ